MEYSKVIDKLNEALKQIGVLSNENKYLKESLDDVNKKLEMYRKNHADYTYNRTAELRKQIETKVFDKLFVTEDKQRTESNFQRFYRNLGVAAGLTKDYGLQKTKSGRNGTIQMLPFGEMSEEQFNILIDIVAKSALIIYDAKIKLEKIQVEKEV